LAIPLTNLIGLFMLLNLTPLFRKNEMTLRPIIEIEDPVSRSPVNALPRISTDMYVANDAGTSNSVLKMEVSGSSGLVPRADEKLGSGLSSFPNS
jgi:hypothetical protein